MIMIIERERKGKDTSEEKESISNEAHTAGASLSFQLQAL